ncbi:MAG: hypothetical protein PVG69_16295, partial [Desulfobacterales bacterium]
MRKAAFITLALIFGPFMGISAATETTLFGPNQYMRTKGKPNLYTGTFLGIKGEARLIVINGDKGRKNRISSARISVNGEQILGPSDFKQRVYRLEAPVNLEQEN